MTEQTPQERIKQLRGQLVVHRYLYYVLSDPLWNDARYDSAERELKALLEFFPDEVRDDCPTKTVGSSNPEDYPAKVAELAQRLLDYDMDQRLGRVLVDEQESQPPAPPPPKLGKLFG